MKIVFIEGISGVGKTTLTKKLYDELVSREISVDCYLEFDFMNPIDFYCAAYFDKNGYVDLLKAYSGFSKDISKNTIVADDIMLVRYYNKETPLFPEPLLGLLREHEFCWNPIRLVPISEYTRVYKSVWEQFALKTNNQFDCVFFDGSLLHHPINDMMRNYSASCDQIVSHISILLETVRELNPQVFYLSSDNIAERLQKARATRNEALPSADQIKFWEDRKKMDMAVMQELPIRFDTIDISRENWEHATEQILKRVTFDTE